MAALLVLDSDSEVIFKIHYSIPPFKLLILF